MKSSFIVIDADRVNFINPSVLDFLSKEVADPDVLELLAKGACHLDELRRLWEAAVGVGQSVSEALAPVAKAIQSRLIGGNLDGRMSLKRIAPIIEEILWTSPSPEFVAYLRNGELSSQVWIRAVSTRTDSSGIPFAAAL